MRSRLSITVNGKRRSVLVLAIAKPVSDLKSLSVTCSGRCSSPLYATPDDYRSGGYWLRESEFSSPGTYRAHAVEIVYTDGTITSSEIADEIVIEVPNLHRGPGPEFQAR